MLACAVEEDAKVALRDPERLGDLFAGLLVQDAEEHDLALEARHPKDATVDPRQLFSSRNDGCAVIGTRGERLDLEGYIRPAPPRGLASKVLDVVPKKHREQFERVVAITRYRSRLWQPQEGDEAFLNCIERIIWVEAALASIGEQPLAVSVDELCNPPEKPGRRVEASVSRLVVLEKLCGQGHGHISIGRLERERYTSCGTTELICPIAEPQ